MDDTKERKAEPGRRRKSFAKRGVRIFKSSKLSVLIDETRRHFLRRHVLDLSLQIDKKSVLRLHTERRTDTGAGENLIARVVALFPVHIF
jgi:hypothetical protein